MEVQSTLQQTAPARLSRYRTVRKATAQQEQQAPPVPKVPKVPQDQTRIGRTPSRYHRPSAARTHDVPLPVPVTTAPVAEAPTRYRKHSAADKSAPAQESHVPEESDTDSSGPQFAEKSSKKEQSLPQPTEPPHQLATASNPQPLVRRASRYRTKSTVNSQCPPPLPSQLSHDAAREEARQILDGEHDRLQRLRQRQEQMDKEQRLRLEAKRTAQETEDAKANESTNETDTKTPAQSRGNDQPRRRKWTIGSGSGSGRGRTSPPSSTPQSPQMSQKLQPVQESSTQEHSTDIPQLSGNEPPSQTLQNTDIFVRNNEPAPNKHERRPTRTRLSVTQVTRIWEPKAGDGPPKTAVNGPQPALDAPVSAVNAGERRVEIRFDKSTITLPVKPSTTVKDLLNSASVVLSQPIDPRTSVLVETYQPLGLERPLRRYEHIRDVMNAWDNDAQNYLMIVPGPECAAVGLEEKDAPINQPSHTMLNLFHSQRPGKWEKHWMILKTDGQVTASTKENDGNANNAFHLSDFDIYTPTKKQLRKLKPPKKICFAIKSQQRSIMFESTENFIHFFSTNDKAVADQWYNAVQAWRSWYLVNVLEQGNGPNLAAQVLTADPTAGWLPAQRPSTSHSRDTVPYQLGTFKPLLDFSADAFTYGDEGELEQNRTEPKILASPKRTANPATLARKSSVVEARTIGLERRLTTKRSAPPGSFHINPQESIPNAPLLPMSGADAGFTGKGLLARAYSVKKTQAEDGLAFLENTDNAFTGKGLLSRRMSTRKVVHENPNPGFIENTNDAFTGAGLMSLQRSLTKKRSTVNARPGQPLLDLAGNSNFASGSLLRQVEGYEIATGSNLPPIDRSRGLEIRTKVGEF